MPAKKNNQYAAKDKVAIEHLLVGGRLPQIKVTFTVEETTWLAERYHAECGKQAESWREIADYFKLRDGVKKFILGKVGEENNEQKTKNVANSPQK
jgi:hypothetical protein